jgi:hypothetical protein
VAAATGSRQCGAGRVGDGRDRSGWVVDRHDRGVGEAGCAVAGGFGATGSRSRSGAGRNNERIDEPALRRPMLQVFAQHAPSVVINDEPATSEQVWQK